MEQGVVSYPVEGTPQGGVLSPLLANIFLHEVLDTWFFQAVIPRLRGRAFLVRYADDAVLGFAREEDARRVMSVLSKRFGKYGLTLHPEKTRLVDFLLGQRGIYHRLYLLQYGDQGAPRGSDRVRVQTSHRRCS